ncbi:branched-chain amino acid ABC transporter ATP-binding protein/permease [Lichenifustis flavocetrariae]|uniref:ATP-binding cassette domain-containing protein n=1 Tax=Lichenifustis flavocetrariae TaxID=2949735 RepID=A0AA42CL35_9HYPH|nr:ATP-binding cassette domain-containing protein [Lichenifustis flavocetrariae]MCW6511209.1 ATP-binding cassette domain-containing protein [Lichenifustis flavocetrariae]
MKSQRVSLLASLGWRSGDLFHEALPIALIVGVGALGLQPFGLGSPYLSAVAVMAGIYMLLAMGLNVVVGFSGLLDLGYVGFWAVGAYATAIVTGVAPFHIVSLDFWQAIPVAIFAAVTSGLFLGLVTLRVRGDYLAIVTLGFGEIVRIVANSWDSVTGGPSGITDIQHPEIFGLDFGLDPRRYVLLTWLFIGLLYFIISNLWRSKLGRAWYATKQDEDAAEIIGVPTFRMKLLAFATGASTAGFAGAVYSSYVGYIIPSNFVLLTAIMVLAAVVLGGMGNMKGAMVGAILIVFLPELFRPFAEARFLIFGVLLVVAMVLRPDGLFPLRPRRYRLRPVPSITFDSSPAIGPVSPGTEFVLECRDVGKRFGGLVAVRGVDVSIRKGEIFAIIGPNGAGKSTLFNLISGTVKPDSGTVALAGNSINALRPHAIAKAGIARTFQLIRLFSAVTVLENVLVGADLRIAVNPVLTALGLPGARRADMQAIAVADAALSFCGIAHLAPLLAGSLSYGDQRRVEIARALAAAPKVLLLDEPAAGMNPTERKMLGELVRKIRVTGVTVVIVEHDVNLVMGIADAVLVLERGAVIAYGKPETVQRDRRVIEAYLGRRTHAAPAERAHKTPAEPLLEVRDLKVSYGPIQAVHGVDLEVRRGEIVALIGANGAGKSSTLLALSGARRASSGTISFEHTRIEHWPAHRIAATGIALVPEGRRVFPRMTVWENLAMGSYARAGDGSDQDLERMFDLFPILKARLTQPGGSLSGGEQQMLAMARALMSRPTLLMLDEPSMGLAPQIVDRIFEIIENVNAAGTSVLLVEQNAEKSLAIADRAYVIEGGRIRLSGAGSFLLDHPDVQAAYLGA